MTPLDRIRAARARTLIPAERLSVSDWLDEHRMIGVNYPSPFTGPWRTDRTPYLREPLDSFDDPEVEKLVLLFSSQIGKTEAALGMLLYAYGADPGPGMYVMPTVGMAEDLSKNRLIQALGSCDALSNRIGEQKGRSSESSILNKRINDSPLALSGAESPASLASRPIRRLFCDEIDKWPTSTLAGDPLKLAEQRTMAFRRRKIVLTSTPLIKGASRIEQLYEDSDRRVLMAPCPRCGKSFEVRWHHIRWENRDPTTAHIEHLVALSDDATERGEEPGCGGRIEDWERGEMFAKASWEPTAPFAGIRGYRAWAVVSPWVSLAQLVDGWVKAQRDPSALQQFINEKLGESWEIPSEKVEAASLLMRREDYPAEVPAGGIVLTAGVDTQDDRLEVLVAAWGPGEEVWVVGHEVCFGDPARSEVWEELDHHLLRQYTREGGGVAQVQCALIDALGHRTESVYRAVLTRQHRRIFASIGKDGGLGGQIVAASKILPTKQGNVLKYIVDASQVKALVYSRLRILERTGAGVIHFPMTVGDAFFTSLTSEHLIIQKNKLNIPTKKWAMRPGYTRNEVLDCFGMATAALRIICPTPTKFAELAAKLGAVKDSGAVAPRPVVRGRRTAGWTPPR